MGALGEASAAGLKSLVGCQKSMKFKLPAIKTLWPARKATTYKARWKGAYSIGLTIPGTLGCPKKKKKNRIFAIALQPLQFPAFSHKYLPM